MDRNEAELYAKFLQETKGASPEEARSFIKEKYGHELEPSAWEMTKGAGKAVLHGAGKALDYLGGNARNTVMQGLDAVDSLGELIPGNEVHYRTREGDTMRALQGDAPGISEIRERLGHKDGTLQKIVNTIGDAGLDPLSYGTAGVKTALKMGSEAAGAAKLTQLEATLAALHDASQGSKTVNAVDKTLGVIQNPLELATPIVGKKTYKSGLKRIDQEVEKYGKDPVSDILMEHNIWGNADTIAKKMSDLGEQKLAERNVILKDATKQGAEVSMKEAMAPVLAKVQELRLSKDPVMQGIAADLEKRANQYLALDAKEAEDFLRTLPVGGEHTPGYSKVGFEFKEGQALPKSDLVPGHTPVEKVPASEELVDLPTQASQQYTTRPRSETGIVQEAGGFQKAAPTVPEHLAPSPENQAYWQERVTVPGETVPDKFVQKPEVTVIDKTERVAGPDPMTANKYKSSAYGIIPDNAWRDPNIYGQIKGAEKALSGGLKSSIETSVGRTMGDATAERLAKTNDELGRILTSKERASIEAAKEANKNTFTSIDGILMGNMLEKGLEKGSPLMFGIKKLADAAKLTSVRTGAGRAMTSKTAQKITPLMDDAIRRGYINLMRPDEEK
jgi:hypothetical protein